MVIRRLVLWDVDGTLVRAGDIGAAVFDQAIADMLGVAPPERIRMSGKTDPLIVCEYLHLMGEGGRPDLAEVMSAVLDRLVIRLASDESRAAMAAEGAACPGAAELLSALAGDDRIVSSLLTGNLRPNAEVKVSAFGLHPWLDLEVGAYGDDHEDRNCLVPVALKRVSERLGASFPADEVWVVGDTPRDLACARAAGARCLLVATGRYSLAALEDLGPDALFDDLTDIDRVLKHLTGDL